jgi:hypothetical protein
MEVRRASSAACREPVMSVKTLVGAQNPGEFDWQSVVPGWAVDVIDEWGCPGWRHQIVGVFMYPDWADYVTEVVFYLSENDGGDVWDGELVVVTRLDAELIYEHRLAEAGW